MIVDVSHMGTADFLALILQVLIPILVGLVTKASTKPSIKAGLLVVLTALNQFFVGWAAAGNHFDWKTYLANIVIGAVISIAMHKGIMKPIGVAAVAQSSLVKDTPPVAVQPAPPSKP